MAIYHCNIKTFSRSKGDSAISAIAYRTGTKLYCDRTGRVENYTKRKDVEFHQIVAPPNSPIWAYSTESLWQEVEKAENRKNSTVAREFEYSLPHELNKEQRQKLAQELTQKLVDRFGFVAQYAIHAPKEKDSKNFHVHVLASTRKLSPTGFTEKTRELDEMMAKDKDNKNPVIVEVRAMIADVINAHLAAANIKEKVSHKSLLDQQKDAIKRKDYGAAILLGREPTRHIGKNPVFMKGNIIYNKNVAKENKARLAEVVKDLEKPIIVTTQEVKAVKSKIDLYKSISKALKWLIEGDHFGIEKREKLALAAKKQEELRLENQEIERRKLTWAETEKIVLAEQNKRKAEKVVREEEIPTFPPLPEAPYVEPLPTRASKLEPPKPGW